MFSHIYFSNHYIIDPLRVRGGGVHHLSEYHVTNVCERLVKLVFLLGAIEGIDGSPWVYKHVFGCMKNTFFFLAVTSILTVQFINLGLCGMRTPLGTPVSCSYWIPNVSHIPYLSVLVFTTYNFLFFDMFDT